MSNLVQIGIAQNGISVLPNPPGLFYLQPTLPLNALSIGQIVVIKGVDAFTSVSDFWTCTVQQVIDSQNILLLYTPSSSDVLGTGTINVPPTISIYTFRQTSFTPQKFIVFQGQVWCRDTSGVFYQYGGATNTAYDTTQATVTTPWLDLGQPTMQKTSTSIDYAVFGGWTISGSMDFNGIQSLSDSLKPIVTTTNATLQGSFQNEEQSWTDDGYHVQFQATSTDPSPAVLSEIVYNFETNESK